MYFELHTCHIWCQNEVSTMQKAKTDIIAASNKPSLLIHSKLLTTICLISHLPVYKSSMNNITCLQYVFALCLHYGFVITCLQNGNENRSQNCGVFSAELPDISVMLYPVVLYIGCFVQCDWAVRSIKHQTKIGWSNELSRGLNMCSIHSQSLSSRPWHAIQIFRTPRSQSIVYLK